MKIFLAVAILLVFLRQALHRGPSELPTVLNLARRKVCTYNSIILDFLWYRFLYRPIEESIGMQHAACSSLPPDRKRLLLLKRPVLGARVHMMLQILRQWSGNSRLIDASISASYGNLKQKGELMLPINRQLDRLYGQKSIFFPKRPSLVLNEKPSLVTSPISYSPTYWATYSRLDRIRRSSLSWILWINHLINLCFHCFF